MKKINFVAGIFVAGIFASFVFIFIVPNQKVQALSGSEFNPGRIIDDSVFYQPNSMTASQIQSFLNSQVPSCSSGYTCLKDYHQNTPTQNAISGICTYLPAVSNDSAADIIYRVSSACGINPKVIIVLLQKEQGLVTSTDPSSYAYQEATGYGCPDGGNCSADYYGFFNQVYDASWQFKEYQANPGNFTYVSGQYNNIQYNPNAGCGTEKVYIQNEATAGLYDYTPYVPNAAALQNVSSTSDGGYGDGCSAYGNRNFWWYFNSWFGSTYASPFFSINGGSARYVLGDNGNYYHVPSLGVMVDYGFESAFHTVDSEPSSYLNGLTNSGDLPQITRFDGGAGIYQIDVGGAHVYPNQAVLNAFGYTTGQAADLPSWIYNDLAHPSQMAQVVKQTSAPEIYYVQNDKKSHIINKTAYTTMGSPAYSSQANVTLSTGLVQNIALGAPIMPDGTLLKTSDANYFGIWNGSLLQQVSYPIAVNLRTTYYLEPAAAVVQAPAGGPTLGNLAKDSSDNLYILDNGKKINVSSGQLANLGLGSGTFVTSDDAFLSSIPSVNLPTPLIVRVNGGSGVYLIQNAKVYLIPSRADFDSMGYNMGNVLNVDWNTFTMFSGTNEFLLSDNKLVRVGNESQVYLIDYSSVGTFQKFPIASRATFDNYGFNMGNVYSIPADELNGYVTVSNLPQIVKDGTGNVWLIDMGVKHSIINTLQASGYYNINPANLQTLSDNTINGTKNGGSLTDYIRVGAGAVYKVIGGKKEMYTSAAAFNNDGGNWNSITQVSSAYIASLPSGPNIN